MSGILVGAASGYATAVGGVGTPDHYSPFTIDHTQVPSTQTDFPVLINVTDARFKTVANGGHVRNANGFDIRPYSDSGLTTALTYELERYNASTGEVVMHVKIASLSSSVDTVIYLAYGNIALTSNGSSPSTWSNGYLGVYHLGNGATLGLSDSTGVNNGTNNGATAATGQVDGGAAFVSASSQYIALPNGATPVASGLTYSAWVKATNFPNSFNAIIVRTNGTIYSGLWVKSDGHCAPFITTSGGGFGIPGSHTLVAGTWYHVVFIHDTSFGLTSYVNAAFDGDNTGATSTTLNTTALPTRIGGDSSAAFYWNGTIDEVRIASVSRTANWVTTEYNNQSAPGTFMTLGTEV